MATVATKETVEVEVHGIVVVCEGHAPVTPCPCHHCGALIEVANCRPGWGALQLCGCDHD